MLSNFQIKKKKNKINYEQELILKLKLLKKLNLNYLIKFNLKLNLNYLINKFNFFNNFNFSLVKKNYYNLINSNSFFENLILIFSNLKLKKAKKKFTKKNIKSLKFSDKKLNFFIFYFLFFIFKKNNTKKILILKNFLNKKKNFKKKKPLIKLNYFKLLKNLTSYNNEMIQKNYESDQLITLIINFNENYLTKKLKFSLISLKLIFFNLFKLLKN